MSFLRLYLRVLEQLGTDRRLAWFLAFANVALALAQFAEPVLFGRVINLLAGVWLLIAAFLIGTAALSPAPSANDFVLGLLLVGSSWWILASPTPATGAAWFQVLCGLWLIISPFVLEYSRMSTSMTNAIITGIVATVVGLIEGTALVRRTM